MRGTEEEDEEGGGGGGANPSIESLLGGRPFMVGCRTLYACPLARVEWSVVCPRSWLRSDVKQCLAQKASEGADRRRRAQLSACWIRTSLYA